MDFLVSDLRGGRSAMWLLCLAVLAALCCMCCTERAQAGPPNCKVEDPSGKETCHTKLAGAEWSISPTLYSFGARGLDLGPSPSAAFVLTNTGKPALTASSFSLTWADPEGADPDLFAITSNDCGTLERGESCTIEISFDPVLPGIKYGQLTVVDTTQSASAILDLEGSGRVMTLSPPSLTFGAHEVGGAPATPQEVTVTNTSQYEPVTLYSLALGGDQQQGAGQFRLTGGNCEPELIIPPRGSCEVGVSFLPSAAGAHQASLRLIDSAPEAQQSSVLEGEGTPPVLFRPKGFIIRHPAKRTTQRRATFEFSGTPNAHIFECHIDARPFAQCGSPVSFYRLRTGQHTFEVRAVDTTNGDSSEVIGYRWKVAAKRHR